MLAQRFVRRPPKLLHASVAALPLQRLAAPLVSGKVGCLPSARGVCTLGPLLRGGGFSTPPAILTVRSGTVGGGGGGSSGSVVTLPQQGYRSASGTNRLKAKLKAKHRRAKGGANPRGKSQLPKGKRKSRKKPLPGRR